MIYLALAFVTLPLAFLSMQGRMVGRKRPRLRLEQLHNRIAHHLALSNWSAAGQLLGRLRTKEALSHPTTHQLKVRFLRATGCYDEALEAASEARRHLPKQLLFLLEEGRLLVEMGRGGEAIELLERATPIARGEEDLLLLGQALYQTGRVDEAWEVVEPLLLDGGGRVHALAGDCLLSQKSYTKALFHFEQAVEQEVESLQLLARIGHCLIRVGRLDEAESQLRKILQLDSGHLVATLSLGCCLEEQERYAEALAVYQGGTAWELANSRILRQAGICAFHLGRFDHAERYLSKAFQLGATGAKTLAFLAYSFECQEKWGQAEEIFRTLIDRHSDYIVGYRGLAWLYGVGLSVSVSAEEGLACAQRSVEILSDSSSWEVVSACEARAGNFNQAHRIQESLKLRTSDRADRRKRLRAMRVLRQGLPLNEKLVERALVA